MIPEQPGNPHPGLASFRGREAELQQIGQVIGSLLAGHGNTLVVEGPAGIGKSRLLDELAQSATTAGVLVARGQAEELDGLAPLTPLLGALRSGPSPVLAREELRTLERPGDQRFWLLEELTDLLERRCQGAPLAVIIDDVHWADQATVWALQGLARRLTSSPIAWVVAGRPGEMPTYVKNLLEHLLRLNARRIVLGAVDDRTIDQIAADLLGAAPQDDLRTLLAGAGGNPFLVIELIRALANDGLIKTDDASATLLRPVVPERFRAQLTRRLSRLHPDTVRFLRTAAIFGQSFRLDDVAALVHSTSTTLVSHVDEAMNADLVVDVQGVLRFRHDLLREAVHEGVPLASRRALHREAANVILSRGGGASEAAAHLIEFAEPGDSDAVGVLCTAAASLATTAPRAAADLMLRAVELMTPGEEGWIDIVVGTVGMLAWATRFREANELADRALRRRLEPMSEGLLRLGVSDALLLTARRADLIKQAQEAISLPQLPQTLRGQFLHNLAQGLGQEGQIDEAERCFHEAMTVISPDNHSLQLSCRIGIALMTAYRGRLTEALALADECVRLCDEAGPEAQLRMPWLSKASILAALDRFDEADADLAEALAVAQRLGASWAVEFTQRIIVGARWYQRRLADAAAEAEAVLEMADALDLWQDTDVPVSVLGLVAFHTNDMAKARAAIQRGSEAGTPYHETSPFFDHRFVEALLLDAEGRSEDAIAGVTHIYDHPSNLTAAIAMDAPHAVDLVRLAMRAHDRSRANSVAATCDRVARSNPSSAVHVASALHAIGLLEGDVGMVVAAAGSFKDTQRALAWASASEDAGRMLKAPADMQQATKYLEQAHRLYVEIGALRGEMRVRQRLRDLGVRRPAPAASRRTANMGLPSLTPAEQRVVRLVAEGRTNKEIAEMLYLSPYTVNTHLKHVFVKLDVSTRTQLAHLALSSGASTGA